MGGRPVGLTEAQVAWLGRNTDFDLVGRPRAVQFETWGQLMPDGSYEERPEVIRLGIGAVGVAKLKQST